MFGAMYVLRGCSTKVRYEVYFIDGIIMGVAYKVIHARNCYLRYQMSKRSMDPSRPFSCSMPICKATAKPPSGTVLCS